MRILLLGKTGQIGWELKSTLLPMGEIIAPGRDELDLANQDAIRRTVRNLQPNLIVNAAAYTAVDQAEEETELAMAVNAIAPRILAEEAIRCKAILVQYSTDYVFDGTKTTSYAEQDSPNPVNAYGKSKLAGEKAILDTDPPYIILRSGWIYGMRGSNFLLRILQLAREQKELEVVNDQIGAPTWCRLIAEATALLIMQLKTNGIFRKTYHVTAAGQTSWYDFAKTILEKTLPEYNNECRIKPVSTEQYRTSAKRPLYTVLSNEKLYRETGLLLPDWQRSLVMALRDRN